MRRWLLLLPLLLFLGMATFLGKGLYLDPSALPSALIDKPFPDFSLQSVLGNRSLTRADLLGKPALVNVWGTWCVACRAEHPVLNKLAGRGVVIYGVNYEDDNAAALNWLKNLHDPYQLNIRDETGSLGVNLGVYGAPETFLIDDKGIIRYRHVGIVDETVWNEKLAVRYQRLVEEGAR